VSGGENIPASDALEGILRQRNFCGKPGATSGRLTAEVAMLQKNRWGDGSPRDIFAGAKAIFALVTIEALRYNILI
jgi:hypothetical protein